MHLYARRRNVAAQVAEDLKTVTYYATPSYGGTQKEKKISGRNTINLIRNQSLFTVPGISRSLFGEVFWGEGVGGRIE